MAAHPQITSSSHQGFVSGANIEILAGDKAFKEIRDAGFRPERIKLMVGASGGPKWLALSRLDQYLSEYLIPHIPHPVDLIGSSIGAWRMACYARSDPLQAFKDFEALYTHQRYSEGIPAHEISDFVQQVLNQLFGGEYAREVVSNSQRRLHVVAVRNRRLLNGHSKAMQGVGLGLAALSNLFSPRLVEALYPRVLISNRRAVPPYYQRPELITLSRENLAQALTASGAIPFVMEPSQIAGGKQRWYWDGGLVDYHFAGPFKVDDGLIFYPHFSRQLIPGWFDKGLSWRRVNPLEYGQVVVLRPSAEFIAGLPFGKIPDRKDFVKMNDVERESYWDKVLDATRFLVDDFHEAMAKDGLRSLVKPLL